MQWNRLSATEVVYLAIAVFALMACSGESSRPALTHADASPPGSGGASVSTGTGSGTDGSSAGGRSADGMLGARDASIVTPDPGTCPMGFVRCSGLCLESAVMGADCHP